VVTNQKPKRRWLQSVTQARKPDEARLEMMGDAEVVARWLNDSRGACRRRILAIHAELETLRSAYARLQEFRATSPALKTKAPPMAEKLDAAAWTAKYRRDFEQLQDQTNRLNKILAHYAFRPGVGYTVITDMRGAGLVPDANKGSFRLRVGEFELVEGDAALALVRLYLKGELGRVQLCEMCKKRWRVKAKSHYRFCSDDCRESYYAKAPDYHSRKAATQRRYRENQKRRDANEKRLFKV
jgi:hypothetical protein